MMDAKRFDRLAKTLSKSGTRRGLVRLLAVLPLAGGLAVLLDETGEAGRQHRRAAQHRHQTGNNKEHRKGKRKGKRTGEDRKKGTTPQPGCTPTTCAAQGKNCGTIADGCGGSIRCGPDTCTQPADPCQETTCAGNVCTTGAGHDGASCGSASCTGGTARPVGTCSSGTCTPGAPVSCAPYTQCAGDVCASSCNNDTDCVGPSSCNSARQCEGDLPLGQPCDRGEQCQSGQCVDAVCCATASCDQCKACNIAGQEGTCQSKPDGTSCNDGNACTTGETCSNGVCGIGAPIQCSSHLVCCASGPLAGRCGFAAGGRELGVCEGCSRCCSQSCYTSQDCQQFDYCADICVCD